MAPPAHLKLGDFPIRLMDSISSDVRRWVWSSEIAGKAEERTLVLTDPGTVAAVAAAIVAVAEVVKALLDANNTDQWNRSVSRKLDLLIDLTRQVLDELRSMRVALREDFEHLLKEQVALQILSSNRRMGDTLEGVDKVKGPSSDQRNNLSDISNRVADACYQLIPAGYAWFTAIGSGALTVVGANRVLGVPEQSTTSFINNISEYLKQCVDHTLPGSIPQARQQLFAIASERHGALDSERHDYILGYIPLPPHNPYRTTCVGSLGGSLEQGYVGRHPDWTLGARNTSRIDIIETDSTDFDPNYAKGRGPGNPFNTSGMQHVVERQDQIIRDMNAEASLVIQLYNQCARLDQAQSEIVKMVTTLEGLRR